MKSPHFEVFFRKQDATGPNRAGASGRTGRARAGYGRAHAQIAGGTRADRPGTDQYSKQ